MLSYGRNQSSRCRRSKQHCRQTGYHYALVQIRKPAGKYNPSLKLAYDIARVFRASIEEIFVFVEKAGNRPPHES
ncbi:MAG: hypothetical protein HPY89_03535 [Pelotomaculum sp.]|nr:hypothetical protein [Pelotomaculum sp.]